MSTIQLLDVGGVLKDRSPKIYKAVPRFVIRWLEKIIHQDEMNAILTKANGIGGQEFLKIVIESIGVKIRFSGLENIPKDRKYVFASNHPLGGLDGVSILNVIHSYFGDVKAVVNDLLLYVKNLEPVFTGVNVFGRFTRKQIKILDDLYASAKHIVVFPAGLVSRKVKGKITDLEWKKSFLTKSIEIKRDVIPVYVSGTNTRFFYNFANFRKFLGLKFNLELVFLPREMFKYKGKEIIFHFGKPIPYMELAQNNNLTESVNYIKQNVYALENNNNIIKDFN